MLSRWYTIFFVEVSHRWHADQQISRIHRKLALLVAAPSPRGGRTSNWSRAPPGSSYRSSVAAAAGRAYYSPPKCMEDSRHTLARRRCHCCPPRTHRFHRTRAAPGTKARQYRCCMYPAVDTSVHGNAHGALAPKQQQNTASRALLKALRLSSDGVLFRLCNLPARYTWHFPAPRLSQLFFV